MLHLKITNVGFVNQQKLKKMNICFFCQKLKVYNEIIPIDKKYEHIFSTNLNAQIDTSILL